MDIFHSDFSKIFKFKFVHLGGDEVNTSNDQYLFCLSYILSMVLVLITCTSLQLVGLQHRE